jgi:hypothetical protein
LDRFFLEELIEVLQVLCKILENILPRKEHRKGEVLIAKYCDDDQLEE